MKTALTLIASLLTTTAFAADPAPPADIPKELAASDKHALGVVALPDGRTLATNGIAFGVRDGGKWTTVDLTPQLVHDGVKTVGPRPAPSGFEACDDWFVATPLHAADGHYLMTFYFVCGDPAAHRHEIDAELTLDKAGTGLGGTSWKFVAVRHLQ